MDDPLFKRSMDFFLASSFFEHMRTDLIGYTVSTVELPLRIMGSRYETMVFAMSDDGVLDFEGVYVKRYETADEAREGHAWTVEHLHEIVGDIV